MNLANDLLRKNNGYIHQMPKSINQQVLKKAIGNRHRVTGKYLDEAGKPTSILLIAEKYQVSPCKVRRLFLEHRYEDVYKLIKKDMRKNNHREKVYKFDDGRISTSDGLAKHYGVSKSTIQRCYRDAKKEYLQANKLIEKVTLKINTK